MSQSAKGKSAAVHWHLHSHTTPYTCSWLLIELFPTQGTPSMRDTCVSLTNYPPYTSLPSAHPVLLLWLLIRGKDTVVSSLSPYVHTSSQPFLLPSLGFPPSLPAVCLSPRTCCPTPVFSPRPLPSPLGTMWRKGLGFVSLSRP